jgi:hypothetical protein
MVVTVTSVLVGALDGTEVLGAVAAGESSVDLPGAPATGVFVLGRPVESSIDVDGDDASGDVPGVEVVGAPGTSALKAPADAAAPAAPMTIRPDVTETASMRRVDEMAMGCSSCTWAIDRGHDDRTMPVWSNRQ